MEKPHENGSITVQGEILLRMISVVYLQHDKLNILSTVIENKPVGRFIRSNQTMIKPKQTNNLKVDKLELIASKLVESQEYYMKILENEFQKKSDVANGYALTFNG